jgi:ribonuclease HII
MARRPGSVPPDLALERALAAEAGIERVAGVDEVGRGALAGPVFAAAVVLPDEGPVLELLEGVRDSKLLTPATRERLFPIICGCAVSFGVGSAPAATIDRYGILPATRQAMAEALSHLSHAAQAALVDGPLPLAPANLPQMPVVGGDLRSLSIAAASILAKVSRDRYMIALAEQYPNYGFDRHKGYGTAEHLMMLGRFGPCPEHRLSFAPLRLGLS